MVVITNSTLVSVDALLGATVCATTRDTVSSERHIARDSREWAVEAMALVAPSKGRREAQGVADEVQVRCRTDTKGIVCSR